MSFFSMHRFLEIEHRDFERLNRMFVNHFDNVQHEQLIQQENVRIEFSAVDSTKQKRNNSKFI